MNVLRTLLFAPANHARHVEKALAGAADAVILDLEDAVAASEKPVARTDIQRVLLARVEQKRTTPRVYVRINALATPYAYDDICSVAGYGIDGVVLPKAQSAAEIATVDWLLLQFEREHGLAAGGIELLPLIESVAGLTNLREIATGSTRVRRVIFGAVDFSLDAGFAWRAHHEGLLWARVQMAVASRAAGLEPPIDTVYPRLDDPEGLTHEAEQARDLGFQGKLCIHPKQVEVVNGIFTPSEEQVAEAKRIVETFSRAEQSGVASLQVDGQFVDYPVAQRARRILEIAEHIAETRPKTY